MNELKSKIYEIVDSDIPNKYETFKEIHPYYFQTYPRLMKLACDSSVNADEFKQKLEHFLFVKSQMDDMDITRDEAEKHIGQSLADEYLPI
jgi:hypothetical protein